MVVKAKTVRDRKCMGRPKIELDPNQIEELAALNCSYDEIAAVMGCSVDTIERHHMERIKIGRQRFKITIRDLQMKAAKMGHAAILIWLGKNYLDQQEIKDDKPKLQAEVTQLLKKFEDVGATSEKSAAEGQK